MPVKIVADSCCDLDENLKAQMNIQIAPLTIELDGKAYRDDENFDAEQYVANMRRSSEAPKTACPSPKEFMDAYAGEESIFVVTLSSALSGTYKSAVLAKEMFLEEASKKFIHIFDSFSASVGETLIALRITELAKKGLEDFEIVEKVNEYIKGMKTFFMLETLENLVKAGRISPLIAKVTSILNVRPIMAGTEEGTIKVHEKVIGAKRAFKRFVEVLGEEGTDVEGKVLGIAHCNCLDKAIEFKDEVMKRYNFKDIIIVKTAGVSSTYANEGGLIVAF